MSLVGETCSYDFHPSGWLWASARTCCSILLDGMKWSCLRINETPLSPLHPCSLARPPCPRRGLGFSRPPQGAAEARHTSILLRRVGVCPFLQPLKIKLQNYFLECFKNPKTGTNIDRHPPHWDCSGPPPHSVCSDADVSGITNIAAEPAHSPTKFTVMTL